jgi:hypothetical protein
MVADLLGGPGPLTSVEAKSAAENDEQNDYD